MNIWSRLFGNARRDEGASTNTTQPGVPADANDADCPYCGCPRIKCDSSAPQLYPVWRCSCGAFGSGAWLPDLDEVGDQLLEMLSINSRVSEVCEPTDHPAISMQRYDVNKVEHNLAGILKDHGYEFRVAPQNPNERRYWVKKKTDHG